VDTMEQVFIPGDQVVAGTSYQVQITLKTGALKSPGRTPVIPQHDLSIIMSGNGPAPRALGPQGQPLSIVSFSSGGFGGMTIVWRSVPGTAYRLEKSSNLQTWTPAGLSPDYPAIADETVAAYPPSTPFPDQLFLRVRTLNIP
jgi:hypothetical protein